MKRKKSAIIVTIAAMIISVVLVLSKGDLSTIKDAEQLGQALGFITLLPTLLAVILAFITNNVVFSLLIGFLSGVILLTFSGISKISEIPTEFITQGFSSIKNVLFDAENLQIMLLCFLVGGMIEVVRFSGGFEALAIKLSKSVSTPRKAGLVTSILGCLIFFDDYANALIVGPVMKPIMDRVGVSREKLAYIVDSTAAPVTGIAIISSWVAVEISSIEKGLMITGNEGEGFNLFVRSIPFCFYCLFCLTFIFLNSLISRDFGPMLEAERKARKFENKKKDANETKVMISDKFKERIIAGVGAIIFMIVLAILEFYFNGKSEAIRLGLLSADAAFNMTTLMAAFSNANTVVIISAVSLIAAAYTVILGCIFDLLQLKDALKHWIFGVKNLFPTVFLLAMAWCLADTISRLGTTFYAIEIISGNVSAEMVPLLIFACCCIISFASGSYGCLFVVMPLTVPLAYRMIELGGIVHSETYLSICIGSVMAGSIFGDHCSPVTDCTILSAMGSGCETMDHARTQLPYAMVVAFVSCIAIVMTAFDVPVLITLALGLAIEIAVLYVFGKKPI